MPKKKRERERGLNYIFEEIKPQEKSFENHVQKCSTTIACKCLVPSPTRTRIHKQTQEVDYSCQNSRRAAQYLMLKELHTVA